jgi:hypothetical protein
MKPPIVEKAAQRTKAGWTIGLATIEHCFEMMREAGSRTLWRDYHGLFCDLLVIVFLDIATAEY